MHTATAWHCCLQVEYWRDHVHAASWLPTLLAPEADGDVADDHERKLPVWVSRVGRSVGHSQRSGKCSPAAKGIGEGEGTSYVKQCDLMDRQWQESGPGFCH